MCTLYLHSPSLQARVDSGQFDKTEIIKFDMYQNAVALALIRILHRLNWGRLKMSAEEGSEGGGGGSRAKEAAAKSIQSLTGLLSWQLATMWDTVQRVSVYMHVQCTCTCKFCIYHSGTTVFEMGMYGYTCTCTCIWVHVYMYIYMYMSIFLSH